jgi:hypothetical protein
MYDDYDDYDPYLDDLDDLDADVYNDFEFEAQMIEDSYESELSEVDEYWDRENEYIMNNDVYTDDEKRMIIEQHNSIRNSKKEEIQSQYEFEKDDLEWQKEQAAFDRQMEREDREFERLERENELLEQSKATSYSSNYYKPERPGFIKRTLTAAAIYHFLKKLF